MGRQARRVSKLDCSLEGRTGVRQAPHRIRKRPVFGFRVVGFHPPGTWVPTPGGHTPWIRSTAKTWARQRSAAVVDGNGRRAGAQRAEEGAVRVAIASPKPLRWYVSTMSAFTWIRLGGWRGD